MKLAHIVAMMKQDNVRKMTPPMRSIDQKPTTTRRSGLWRMRSTSEAPPTPTPTPTSTSSVVALAPLPPSAPRSPITKAFDFLPWSRGKRYTTDIKGSEEPSPEAPATTTSSSMHFHRNIFRSGGNSIRDIIAERLHKGKENSIVSTYNSYRPQNKSYGKQKGIITRNKSLDIHELIGNVQNEMSQCRNVGGGGLHDERHVNATARQNGSKHSFLDDTFVENIWREKCSDSRWSSNNNNNETQEHNEDDRLNGGERYSCSIYDPDEHDDHETDSSTKMRSSFHTVHNNNNTAGNIGVVAPKHIIFNDENVVYLIKKELPVRRHEANKITESSRSSKKPPPERNKTNNGSGNNNILRARLKFKKLPTESNGNINNLNNPNNPNNNNNNIKANKISISRNHGRHLEPSKPGKKINNNSVESLGPAEPKRHGTLQRQNTSPTLLGDAQMNRIPSPLLGLGSGERFHDRRKSFSEAILHRNYQHNHDNHNHHRHDNQNPHQHQQHHHQQQSKKQQQQPSPCTDHSSSSSSMGSTVSSERERASTGGLVLEQLKSQKPRKKLSFREPVVTEKVRRRRLSSPMQTMNGEVAPGASEAEAKAGLASGTVALRNEMRNENNQFSLMNHNPLDIVVPQVDAESQAMRIVRTVGQAFEVCHKFKFHKNSVDRNDERSDVSSELLDGGGGEHIAEPHIIDKDSNNRAEPPASAIGELSDVHSIKRPNHLELMPRTSPSASMEDDKSLVTPSSPSHEIIKLKDQLEQQTLQTRQALAQLMLVREQLISETNARIEAQARTQQLLQQNRELLEHLASLGAYNEQQSTGLTSANIAMAPQSQLQMLLQATNANNNLATINQQISNLGSINQQLTSLSHQLSGLNQQSQNLQNFQNIQNMNANIQPKQQQPQQQQQQQQQQSPGNHQQQQQEKPHSPQQQSNIIPLSTLLNTSHSSPAALAGSSSSPYPSMNQLRTISNQLQQINAQATQQQLQQDALSKDLVQVNQDLLNRLQALNLGGSAAASVSAAAAAASAATATSPNNSFFFVNPMSCSPQTTANMNNNNNNSPSNFNYLNSPNSLLSSGVGGSGGGNLTPSPMSTLNRNSFTHSPIAELDGLHMSSHDKNLNRIDEFSLLTTALGQRLPSMAIATGGGGGGGATSGQTSTATTSNDNSRSTSTIDSQSSPRSTNEQPPLLFNTVTLKVTDESGNVTNQRKLSATPSFITRSTSEKVPNRSQMMSEVQRTTWARHTTK